MADFVDGGRYASLFERPLNKASHQLRQELRALLGGTQLVATRIEERLARTHSG